MAEAPEKLVTDAMYVMPLAELMHEVPTYAVKLGARKQAATDATDISMAETINGVTGVAMGKATTDAADSAIVKTNPDMSNTAMRDLRQTHSQQHSQSLAPTEITVTYRIAPKLNRKSSSSSIVAASPSLAHREPPTIAATSI
jgi:hypothetical protein